MPTLGEVLRLAKARLLIFGQRGHRSRNLLPFLVPFDIALLQLFGQKRLFTELVLCAGYDPMSAVS